MQNSARIDYLAYFFSKGLRFRKISLKCIRNILRNLADRQSNYITNKIMASEKRATQCTKPSQNYEVYAILD